jgi:hypothetical protein
MPRSPASRKPDPSDDPVLKAARDAPLDDEPETDEERAAIEEARREVAEGKLIPHDEVRRKLGL